ncbi:MAG: lytic transglycosylase domain-containing protein [Lachnospira sp.]|nr:lytic transglycosylase domain-containing protein [Lachnospira sp.]
MNQVNSLNIIDGNQYQIQNTQTSENTAVNFDEVFQQQSEEVSLDDIFNKVSKETGVDVKLLKAVAQAESGFDAGAVSYCGAQGIMQLMPATSESMGVEDPFDAEQNITGGAKVLAYLLDDYDGNVSLALAAYNAGSGNVAKYGGVPPFNETRNYINKINDILGGALSNDSLTIDGAKATNLSATVTGTAPDAPLHGKTGITGQAEGASGETNTVLDNQANSQELLSFEEYLYFAETYQKIMEQLFQTVNTQMDQEDLSAHTSTSDAEAVRSLSESGTLRYDVNQANITMLTRSSDDLMKSDAQSLYQAQASMVSPLVERLLNR